MAFTTPSLIDVWTRLRNSMRAFLPGTDAWIEPNNLSIAGRSFSLAIGSVYERVLYLYKQLFASTADGYHLEFRHAFEFGITRKPSSPSQGYVAFTQVSPFQSIPAGYTVPAPDGNVFAFLTTANPDANGNCIVEVQCVTTAVSTNELPNTALAFAPDAAYPCLSGVVATVGANGLGGGADQESDDELRTRVAAAQGRPPAWRRGQRLRAMGIRGAGRHARLLLSLRPQRFDAGGDADASIRFFDDTRVNGVPTANDLLAVAEYIDPLRPVTSRLFVSAAQPSPVNVQIANLMVDSPALRASIQANLAAMIFERCPVITASNQFTLPIAWIYEAVSRSDGYLRADILQPLGDVSFQPGQIPTLGTVSFNA